MTPQPVDSTLPPHTLSNATSAAEDSMLMELCGPNSAPPGLSPSSDSPPPPPGSGVHTPPPSPGLKLKGPGSPRLAALSKSPPCNQASFGTSDFGTSAMAGAAKVLSFQNLSSMANAGAVNSRVSPSYSMFQTAKEDKVEGDYDCIGETGQLYLGSLESGFTQNFDNGSPELSYKAVLHHNCSQLLICTHSINTETLEMMQTELSSRNCKVSFVSSAEEDCVQQCARLILPAPLRTFVVCDDGDRVGPAIIATYMLWNEAGTYDDWITWVQGYRPSTEKGWWKGRKRKGSSEVTDTECDSDGPAPSLTATDPGMESPKRTKPNEAYDIDEEFFIGNPAKCNFTTHRDPNLPTSDSPTPLLTPPPPATHGLEWPSGLTFDCGLLNSEEMRDQMETPGSGNQTTGLTPMMQGKAGGEIEGGFSLS
ncbi:hypothetical protein TrRE_jg3957 [Triparma retinervis]|uniref:Uncharacterized protein n=1 Tax=Triparma retinervis TaxID=2557542 RepID=A0A9W6ZL90_9STRA|nr:hypothetical protein TrRE_jg3957 [Triparma retinervis]